MQVTRVVCMACATEQPAADEPPCNPEPYPKP